MDIDNSICRIKISRSYYVVVVAGFVANDYRFSYYVYYMELPYTIRSYYR